MKKIIIGLFSLVVLFTAQNAFAATWNGASNDCKGISIANATTNEGYGNPCWPSTSVSASAGDTLNVRIYYHNTGTVTTNNTRVSLSAPIGSASSSKSFSGSISSDQGSLSLGSVVANLSSSQTLTFNSVKWYTNNTSVTPTTLLNGQSGSEILSGGLDIGSIAPGWATQGSLVVSFHVSNTTTPTICTDTTASNYGGSLPCTYPALLCRDIAASNYLGVLPCTYPAQVCRDTTATNYLGALPCNYYVQPQACVINSFYASPSSVTSGNPTTLYWNTSNCTNATISNLGYNIPVSGSQIIYPTQSRTYNLTASNSTGYTTSQSIYISVDTNSQICRDISATNYGGTLPCTYYVQPYTCSISSFTTSDTNIENGDYSTLRWSTNNCTSVYISGIGSVSSYGSRTVYPGSSTTYTITGYGSNGVNDTDSVRVYVNSNNYSSYCSINSFTTDNTYVNSGNAATLRWSTSGCNNISISGIGSVSSYGSQNVYPYNTTSYTITAYGGTNGTQYRTAQINVNSNYTPVVVYNNNVVTTVATNVAETTAQINGLITNSNYGNKTTYFEYGTTVDLGSRTISRSTSGNTNFGEILSNLNQDTIYYFRAVSEDSSGVSRGAIEIFQTTGGVNTAGQTNTIVKKIIVQGTTVTGSYSPIMLKIDNRYKGIAVGDKIDYTVYYKNIGTSKLTNPMVQVFIPKGITLTNTSNGTYRDSERTLSVPISDLGAGEDGTIYLQATVDSLDSKLAQVVTTAVLVYTNKNGAQENAMAYALNNPQINQNTLGAAAFFSNLFGGIGLIGLLILIIVILLLILIARSFYGNRKNTTTQTH